MNRGVWERKALAEYLNISLVSLDALLHRAENPIPFVRLGRRVLVPDDAFQVWLKEETARCGNGCAF